MFLLAPKTNDPSISTKGFSLIELMIVLAIIGVLSSILYPNFASIQIKAKETATKSVLHTLQLSLETYFLSENTYPEGVDTPLLSLITELQSKGVLNKTPTNPFTGTTYTANDASGKILYSLNSQLQQYTLKAFGNGNTTEIHTVSNQ